MDDSRRAPAMEGRIHQKPQSPPRQKLAMATLAPLHLKTDNSSNGNAVRSLRRQALTAMNSPTDSDRTEFFDTYEEITWTPEEGSRHLSPTSDPQSTPLERSTFNVLPGTVPWSPGRASSTVRVGTASVQHVTAVTQKADVLKSGEKEVDEQKGSERQVRPSVMEEWECCLRCEI